MSAIRKLHSHLDISKKAKGPLNPEVFDAAWDAFSAKIEALSGDLPGTGRISLKELRKRDHRFAEAFESAVTAAVQHVVSGIAT